MKHTKPVSLGEETAVITKINFPLDHGDILFDFHNIGRFIMARGFNQCVQNRIRSEPCTP